MSLGGNPMNTRRRAVGMVIESTSGTPAVVSAALANTQVLEAKCDAVGVFDGGESRAIGLHGGAGPRTKVFEKGEASMKTRMRHGDATLSLLQLCGFVLSGVGSNIGTAVWSDMSQRVTGTMYFWEDGRLKRLHGVNGKAVIKPVSGAGGPIDIDWSFSGIFTMMPDAAVPADAVLTTAAYRNAGLTLTMAGGEIPPVQEWELDTGAEYAGRPDVTTNSGMHRYQVEDGSPMLKLDPEARLVSAYDAYGKYLSGAKEAVQILLTEGANTLTLDMPVTQRIGLTTGERDKKLTDDVELELQKDASGIDLRLTESV